MEDKLKFNKAYKAIILLMFITITISLYEFLTALKNFNVNCNIFDFCSGAVEYIPYFRDIFIKYCLWMFKGIIF